MSQRDINQSHILIVDDTAENLTMLRHILTDRGYRVDLASNGETALPMIQERTLSPDLILLDIMMPPGMDGYEVCRRLKADAHTRDIPIIFLSALDDTINKVKAFQSGGVDYIAKPFQIEEILARVKTHLAARQAHKQLHAQNVRLQQEIVERKKAETALHEVEERYRLLVELSPEAIILHQEGILQYVNPAAVIMIGATSQAELIGRPVSAFVHPDEQQKLMERLHKSHLEQQPTPLLEETLVRFDGRLIDVEILSTPITYHETVATQTLIRDITARKQAETAFAEERNLLRTLIDNLPDLIYVKDMQHRFLLANHATIASFGLTTQEELVGKTDFDLHSPEMAQQFWADEQRIIESGQALLNREETILDHRTEATTWLLSTKIPLRDSRNRITGLVGINRDISARKHAEISLLAAHQELQDKNAQLWELNTSKDKFFSIIAHDLRSPFTALLGYIELMGAQFESLSQENLKDYIVKLDLSGKRLYALLENLLTWSRLQRGLMEYTSETFALNEIVEYILELFASNAEQKQIALTHAVPDAIQVYADYAMVNTVMRNLVSNALKFTPSGGRIAIAAQPLLHDVEVSISDTGSGMDQETLDRLFRIDVHHTTQGTAGETGTGLGLLLCQDLIKKNGGTIWVESAIGTGTTFRFTLPQHA